MVGIGSFIKRMIGGIDGPTGEAQPSSSGDAYGAAEEFFNHWNALPKEDLLPHLRDYLDRPMPDFQPGVAIVDMLPDGQLKVRLVGTKRVSLFDQDLTNQNPLAMFSDEACATVGMLARHTVTQPCGNRGTQTIRTDAGTECLGATIALPLKVDDPDAKCFVHFQRLIEDLPFNGKATQILRVNHYEWIDLGAGVPT